MKRKQKESGKCIHCLRNTDDITDDHIIPRFWYPANTPANLWKPTAPSCLDCNKRLGRIEQELGIRMWLCIDSKKPEAKGLKEKAYRALGVGVKNISPREKLHRKKLKEKILRDLKPFDPSSGMEPFPGFGPHEGYPPGAQMYIPLDADGVHAIAEKVVRGLEYIQKGKKRFIEDPYKVKLFFVDELKTQNVVDMMNKLPIYKHGIGFELRRGMNAEEENEILYRIEIWGTWVIYGFITTKTQ